MADTPPRYYDCWRRDLVLGYLHNLTLEADSAPAAARAYHEQTGARLVAVRPRVKSDAVIPAEVFDFGDDEEVGRG